MRLARPLAFLCGVLASFAFAALAQTSSLPPTPPVKLAMNPVTNKLYILDTAGNAVTVLHPGGATTSVPVGPAPGFIAVNPVTNRVYVDNNDASLTVIDGESDAVLATYPIGSTGPITINPLTNVVYVVRLTGPGSDEVTYFNGDTNSWYTIATASFQPNAMAVNPATNRIYVAHYSTGDVRVISGAFDPAHDFPATVSIGVFSHPFAIAANPVTNRVYVITQDARGPIAVIDGATNAATFPPAAAGHATGPQAIAVNPVTNKAYAAFANEVIVIDGRTNALTYIPISGASSGGIALGINYTTNRIFVATAQGAVAVIDGDTDTVSSTGTTSSGTAPGVATNPVLDAAYFFDASLTGTAGATGDTVHAMPITTAITPFPNDASGPSGTLTVDASSSFAPTALPVRRVYYQVDSKGGAWSLAAGSGPFTAAFSNLAPGGHTVYAFAVDGQDAPLATGPQSIPLVGDVVSYTFTVSSSKANASVSIASSANPSRPGQSVTFTASVAGSVGTPTGTVAFRDGADSLCAATVLANGTATCTTSALATGSHPIAADYSGDAQYNAATSSTLTQAVDALATASVSLSSSANPSAAGQSVTFTATLSGSAGMPTGTATFLDGSTAICSSVALSAGTAACATSSLTAGSHSITAQYSGDASYNAATSGAVTQTVQGSAPASVNVALASNGATVSASSTNAAYNLAAVINGDRTGANITANAWVDDTRDVFPDWVRIDFAGTQTIDHVAVYSVQDDYTSPVEPTDTMTFTSFGVTGFDVQGWNGSAWVTLGTVTGNNLVKRTVSFPAATVSAIRVMVNNALLHYSRIVEIEAWTATSTPPPSSINAALASNGGVASASSTNAAYNLAAVNNGDRTGANITANAWVDDTRDMFPDTVEIAFAGMRTIDHVVLYSVQDNYTSPVEPTDTMTFTSFGVTDFDVQGWNGSMWVTLGSVTGNNLVKRTVSFAAASVSAIRVNVNNALLHYSRIVEIEAWTTSATPPPPSGSNFALASNGGVASASSTNAAYNLAAVNNGDRTGANITANAWVDDTRDMFPDTVEIDFPAAHMIDHVVLYSVQDNYTSPVEPTDTMTFTSFGVTDFDVQGWNGSMWVTLGTVTGNNLVKRTVSFPAASVSRVRVVVNNALLHYSRIVEIEAWGS